MDFQFDKYQSAFIKVQDKNDLPEEVLGAFTDVNNSFVDLAFQGENTIYEICCNCSTTMRYRKMYTSINFLQLDYNELKQVRSIMTKLRENAKGPKTLKESLIQKKNNLTNSMKSFMSKMTGISNTTSQTSSPTKKDRLLKTNIYDYLDQMIF